MIGINGEDLNEYLISAEWKDGLVLYFKLDANPFVRTNESVTIAGKSFLVTKCSVTENMIYAEVRGKKFELNHFIRLNKCH